MRKQKFVAYEWMEDANIGLRALVRMALSDTNSRLYLVLESLSQAVWGMDEAVRAVTEDGSRVPSRGELRKLTSTMQGQVLTILEATFESPTQCEAMKSLAKQKVWRYYNRVLGSLNTVGKSS